jgi:hypothetical protein
MFIRKDHALPPGRLVGFVALTAILSRLVMIMVCSSLGAGPTRQDRAKSFRRFLESPGDLKALYS